MSWSRPIFNQGIAGANRAVVNLWTRGGTIAADNVQTLQWARREMNAGNVVSLGLCKLLSAASLATNRWEYSVELFFPPSRTPGSDIAAPTDSTFDYDGTNGTVKALNLREWFNTSVLVDGVDITNPPVTIGPVGSIFNGTIWPTASLSAIANLYVTYDLNGKAFPYFDRPNPTRCTPQEPPE